MLKKTYIYTNYTQLGYITNKTSNHNIHERKTEILKEKTNNKFSNC